MVTATTVKAIHIAYRILPILTPTHGYDYLFPLSYVILVVDICPSVQQQLHNGVISIVGGLVKGRVTTLHNIFIEKGIKIKCKTNNMSN